MRLKTFLIVVNIRQNDDDLKAAIKLCSEFNARLSVIVIAIAALRPIGNYPVGTTKVWVRERQHDLEALEKRVGEVEVLVRDADISATVNAEYPEAARVSRVIGRYARYTDATIIGAGLLRNDLLKTTVVDGALFESGSPILIVPKGSNPTLRPKSVLLAWNSGIECTRAAKEALDILASAKEVHVTLVDPDTRPDSSGPEPGAGIAAYLAHHGIKVDVDRLASGGKSIADVLKRHATDISAELIVMGAYGHSRTREWIFGGVTKSMLDDPSLPVLMAH